MDKKTAIVAAIAVTSAVAFPYITALACNLAFGWPQTRHRYRRAFSPKKVFALNLAMIQKIIVSIRYASLYFQWKSFYKSARASALMKVTLVLTPHKLICYVMVLTVRHKLTTLLQCLIL